MGCSSSKEQGAGTHADAAGKPTNVPQRHLPSKKSIERILQDQLDSQLEHVLEHVAVEIRSPLRQQKRQKSKQQLLESLSSESLPTDLQGLDTPEMTLENSGTSDPTSTSLESVAVNLSLEEQLELKEQKRIVRINNVRAELLETERRYVDNLTTAMEVIMLPIMNKTILDADTAADQFNDFIAIAKFNRIMLDEFEARPDELIATLRKYTPGLKLYTSYLQHFERRMRSRAKLVNNNALHAFLDRALEHDNHSLESFLVEPVQRIPRYKLLLAELHAHTKPGDPEFDLLHLAVADMATMALYNNEAIREMEKRLEQNANLMQVVTLTRINVLDDPTRYLLKTSFNLKCTSAGCMKPLQIWLFNDKIIYGRTGTQKKLFNSTRYVEVPLSLCNVDGSHDDDDDSAATSFVFESERESFLIIAKTADECAEWLEAITTAMAAYRSLSTRRPSGTLLVMAPVWKLNGASNVCDLCGKQFGVRVRRHHCRLCGSLICDTCSSKRVVLEKNGQSHTYQRTKSELEAMSLPELDKLMQKEMSLVQSRMDAPRRGSEKKERVCTTCYNNLSCQYVQHHAEGGMRLEISLLSATDLINMDFLSLSDPYVVFSSSNHTLKSRTIDDNLNPVWGTAADTFCFAYQPGVRGEGEGASERRREICVELYDEDPTYDDFLGSTIIDLNEYPQLDDGLEELVANGAVAGPSQRLDVPLQPPGSGRLQLGLRVLLPGREGKTGE